MRRIAKHLVQAELERLKADGWKSDGYVQEQKVYVLSRRLPTRDRTEFELETVHTHTYN